jgi:hypothetical protein
MSNPTSIVTGVDFVSVPTRDLTAAMDFYGNSLDPHHRYAPRVREP